MITISIGSEKDTLLLKCNYAYRGRCRKLPGAEFNQELKVWTVPLSSLLFVQQEFEGEIYYKTPLWKIQGFPAPPKREPASLLGQPIEIPRLNLTPYDYQEEGIRFMVDRLKSPLGFVMNGDKVGLGKTIQSVGCLKYFAEVEGVGRVLIVAKKSIKIQWAQEIRRITGWQNVPIFITGDTKKKRTTAYEGIRNSEIGGILIANYHNFLNDFEEIQSINFDFCILDEAHCVKAGKMNKRIGEVMNGKKTILLTGTPLMSKPEDIHGIVSIANKDYYGTEKDFADTFLVKEFGRYGEQTIGAKNLDILRDSIKQFYISRSAEEVFDGQDDKTPPKKLPPQKITAPMDSVQEKMYEVINRQKEKIEEEIESILQSGTLTDESRMEIEALNEKSKMFIASLQLISDDPGCFEYLSPEKGINKYVAGMVPDDYGISPKTEATLDIVSEIAAGDEKVIIFCHYYSAARMLADYIKNKLAIKAVMFTGRESDETREKNKDLFCNSDDYSVLVATEAAAEGLNLQKARYMIHYEQADSHALKEQRLGRIARIGSKYKSVISYDMISENSFDEVRLRKIQKDAELSDVLLG